MNSICCEVPRFEASPFLILIPYGPKYSPRDPIPKYCLRSSLNLKYFVSQPYWAVGSIIILYVLLLRFFEGTQYNN